MFAAAAAVAARRASVSSAASAKAGKKYVSVFRKLDAWRGGPSEEPLLPMLGTAIVIFSAAMLVENRAAVLALLPGFQPAAPIKRVRYVFDELGGRATDVIVIEDGEGDSSDHGKKAHHH
jgi:hypothetical protein